MSKKVEPTDFITIIDCGIGTIEYIEPDNLLLQLLMTNLEEAIKRTTPKKVNEILSAV